MVSNSTNINKTKESINSDGQQFYQYQQSDHNVYLIDGPMAFSSYTDVAVVKMTTYIL
jgi:hypothetical protein